MFVKLPTQVSTLRNSSGRSQATVQAQMPPLLIPAIARPSASWRSLNVFSTSGRISSSRNRAYWSESVSYSKLRFDGLLGDRARVDEDADRDRHLLLVDQVVEDGRHEVLVAPAVLEDHDAGRLVLRILGGNVNPPVAGGAVEDFALPLRHRVSFPLGTSDRSRLSGWSR